MDAYKIVSEILSSFRLSVFPDYLTSTIVLSPQCNLDIHTLKFVSPLKSNVAK